VTLDDIREAIAFWSEGRDAGDLQRVRVSGRDFHAMVVAGEIEATRHVSRGTARPGTLVARANLDAITFDVEEDPGVEVDHIMVDSWGYGDTVSVVARSAIERVRAASEAADRYAKDALDRAMAAILANTPDEVRKLWMPTMRQSFVWSLPAMSEPICPLLPVGDGTWVHYARTSSVANPFPGFVWEDGATGHRWRFVDVATGWVPETNPQQSATSEGKSSLALECSCGKKLDERDLTEDRKHVTCYWCGCKTPVKR
jgi:hypothetical protein